MLYLRRKVKSTKKRSSKIAGQSHKIKNSMYLIIYKSNVTPPTAPRKERCSELRETKLGVKFLSYAYICVLYKHLEML